MRCLLIASLVAGLAGLPSASAHRKNGNEGPLKLRKSLGFGPVLPHAVYNSLPKDTSSFLPPNPNADPFDVARQFIDDTLSASLSEGSSYRIRPDSYTDSMTGINQ
ncbi:hypothetical protein MPER_10456, partial [Moniliophthora perniciosa FA553]